MKNYPKVLISSFDVPVPPTINGNRTTYFNISEQIFIKENVGTILNVANEVKPNKLHVDMYKKHGIKYVFLGIDDILGDSLPKNFLNKVLNIYYTHLKEYGPLKAFLVNCQAGVNRSALSIGGILWKTKAPNKWFSPEQMIAEMRYIQKKDRNLDILLINQDFEKYLIAWCKSF